MDDAKEYLEAMEWIQANPAPDYRCVFCRRSITRKPIQDFTLQTITEGFVQDREKVPSDEGTREGPMYSFFNKYLLF